MKNIFSPINQMHEAKIIIKAVLELNVSVPMKRKVIDSMLWNITGAFGKYNTRYISKEAMENHDIVKNHEHVFRKKNMINNILAHPEELDSILENAVGCTVTIDEHKLLGEVDRSNKGIDGWERYKQAGISVYDCIKEKYIQ
jgi:hypothetical protein